MNEIENFQMDTDLQIFRHHIYEYKKGIRNLILLTTYMKFTDLIKKHLKKNNIRYIIYPLGKNRVNVFFGNSSCIEVIVSFDKPDLSELTHEQDFILGIMLGYDRLKQCERYITRKMRKKRITLLETMV